MNKRLGSLLVAMASLLMLSTCAFAQLPSPSYGWNLGNTLEPNCGVGCWGPAPTQALINSVAAQGFNTVRIPCAWVSNSTNGTINSSYMTLVTNVVNWCTAKGMYVIINDHWDGGWFSSSDFSSYNSSLNSENISIWNQVANNFKNYDGHVLFSMTNEPSATTSAQSTVLFQYYQNWINAVRATGGNNTNRWLILCGPNGCSIDSTCSWVTSLPSDPTPGRLMLEVHDYSPFQFTQLTSDASWGAMYYFWGAAYHVSSGPTNRNATWGEESYIDGEFAKMQTQWVNHGIPVLLGEWRASPKPTESDLTGQYVTQNYNSTTYWNYYEGRDASRYGMYATCWDIPQQMFDWTTGAVRDQTMINAVLGRSCVPPVAGLGGGGQVIANGTYKLTCRNGGLALDANGAGTANGTQIIQWSYGGGTNQKWTVTNTGGNNYKIIGVQSGKSLDINGASSSNGTKVQLWAYGGGTNQTFTFTATDSGYYRITPNCATGSCLDVAGSSTSNGANVQLWGYSGGNNEQWSFQAP